MEKFITASPGGISNRIKCLVSTRRLAKINNGQFLLFWPKNWTCNAKFSDLFSNKFHEIDKDELKRYTKNGKQSS